MLIGFGICIRYHDGSVLIQELHPLIQRFCTCRQESTPCDLHWGGQIPRSVTIDRWEIKMWVPLTCLGSGTRFGSGQVHPLCHSTSALRPCVFGPFLASSVSANIQPRMMRTGASGSEISVGQRLRCLSVNFRRGTSGTDAGKMDAQSSDRAVS